MAANSITPEVVITRPSNSSLNNLAPANTRLANGDPEKSTEKPPKVPKSNKQLSNDDNFEASVDFGENYYDLFIQNRTLFEFKTPKPSKFFQQAREGPKPVVLRAVGVFEHFVQRILFEIFSIVRFFFAVIVTILTETLKLVVRGVVQPLIVGFITIMGSHFLQPVLVSVFNYILQPYLSFINNVLQMVQATLQPWFMMIGHLLLKVAEVLKSVRLVEVNWPQAQQLPSAATPHSA